MGLVAREIEAAGIPTIAVSLARDVTASVGVPRALFLRWPLGHPLGEANALLQQRTILYDCLGLLLTATAPGVIAEPGYRWRRQEYAEPEWGGIANDE
ncbi:MAG: hypothetical protein KJZ86_21645 [Caldilineaceae bacterium]|nr:hypothetical protein [Caldilineaceae bacterium]HRJ44939.1 hypothetical protein [Caldilineaceae bacterium]